MKSKTELRNMAAMLSDDVVSVECTFDKKGGGTRYTYLCDKVLARHLERGDVIIAIKNDNGVGFVCARVAEVHADCLLDDPANVEYKWIVGRVPTEEADRLLDWQKAGTDELYNLQRRANKKAVLAELGASEDTQINLALPKASVDLDPATGKPMNAGLSRTTIEGEVDDDYPVDAG